MGVIVPKIVKGPYLSMSPFLFPIGVVLRGCRVDCIAAGGRKAGEDGRGNGSRSLPETSEIVLLLPSR